MGDPDDRIATREALADCLEESEFALKMLDQLMELGQAEAGALVLSLEDVRLGDAIADVIALYEVVAEEAGVQIAGPAPSEAPYIS